MCHILKDHKAYLVFSDEIIHHLLKHDPQCIVAVTSLLGEGVLSGKEIDRKKAAEKVFDDEKMRKKLESLLHPRLFEEIDKEYERACKAGKYSYFVVEMPLVQEIGKSGAFDLIVAVLRDENEARKSFEAQGFPDGEYQRRMQWQWPPHKKTVAADVAIDNNGTLLDLKKAVEAWIQKTHLGDQ